MPGVCDSGTVSPKNSEELWEGKSLSEASLIRKKAADALQPEFLELSALHYISFNFSSKFSPESESK